MKSNQKKGRKQKLLNLTMAIVKQLWVKGIPVSIGDFEFTTAKRQVLLKSKHKKNMKKPYRSIIFDPLNDFPLQTNKGAKNKVKRFRIFKKEVEQLREKTVR